MDWSKIKDMPQSTNVEQPKKLKVDRGAVVVSVNDPDFLNLMKGLSGAKQAERNDEIEDIYNMYAGNQKRDPLKEAVGYYSFPPSDPLYKQRGMQKAVNLHPAEEDLFQEWYSDWASKTGINPNPDDPNHFYDYRAAWKDKAKPSYIDGKGWKWPSIYKVEGHPNMVVDGVNTKTGEKVR